MTTDRIAAGSPARRHRTALIAALLGVAVALVGLPASASASTVAECQAQIDQLSAKTQTVAISGQNADKDRAGLLGKLSSASTKLEQGKADDAVMKLEDFRTKVQSLEAAAQVSAQDAQALTAGANDAIACIGSLSG